MSCKTTHITHQWTQGQSLEFPISYKVDGVLQDLNGYTLEVHVVDKNTSPVFILSETIEEQAERVVLRYLEELSPGTYRYQFKIIKPDNSSIITPIQYFRINKGIIGTSQSGT